MTKITIFIQNLFFDNFYYFFQSNMHSQLLIILIAGLLSNGVIGQLLLPVIHEQQMPLRHSLFHSFKKSDISHSFKLSSHLTSHFSEEYTLLTSGSAFFLPIVVQGIKYNMQIDSGSSDFVIKGENAAGNPSKKYACNGQCEKNTKYQVQYLDGKMQTYEQNLTVNLGKYQFNQSVLIAYQTDAPYIPIEGIIGLSFKQIARNPHPTFLQTLINQKIINTYAFGVNLNFQSAGRSFITFGEANTDFIGGSLIYVNISSKIDFVVNIDGILLGSSGLLRIVKGQFDTGNTCISIPKQYSSEIVSNFNTNSNKCSFLKQVSSPKFQLLYCKVTNFNQLPNLVISINGHYFNVEKEAYLRSCVKDPSEKSSQAWYCSTYIQSIQSTTLYIGDGFFNRYYTYFDMQNYRIGISRNKENLTLDRILNRGNFNQTLWSSINFKPENQSPGFWRRIINFFKHIF